MFTEKIGLLARTIVKYSLDIQAGEKLLIEVRGEGTDPILDALVAETLQAGAVPFWNRITDSVQARFLAHAGEQQIRSWAELHKGVMEDVDAYVSIRGGENAYELSGIPSEKMQWYMQHYFGEVHARVRIPRKKWVVLRWPSASMAQLAEMNTEDFACFYFDTCTLDYEEMSRRMDALVAVMEKTDRVRLVNPATDITFSIGDIPVIKCDGKKNIPDGEVYTAPVRDSMNGYITYNAPSSYQGRVFTDLRLEVRDGRIGKVVCPGNQEKAEAVFDTDEGARYFGEFAIGVNPFINFAMKDTLFDEKIYGSFHLTPGRCYEEASNGNDSAIHWDLVQIQTPEFGGGEIWFDDVLVRKDGEFVLDELKILNKPLNDSFRGA